MKALRGSQLLLGALLALDWAGMRELWWPQHPSLFASGVGLLLLSLVYSVGRLGLRLAEGGEPRGRGLARLLAGMGLLLVLGGGMANWLFGLQGAVILNEGEVVPLASGTQLQAFDAGPLSNIDEMHLTLLLEKLEMVPAGEGTFSPLSRLRILKTGEAPVQVEVAPGRVASQGTLFFHQGAFGFAPRVVISRNGTTLFDQVVPFTTQRHGPGALSYEGSFRVEKEGLRVSGGVDLSSLDERLKGHARLALEVYRGELLLGRGDLAPGYFADISEGYRVGFAGLERWSEIDLSRRNYPKPMLAGAALMALGGLGWIIGTLRARKAR